MAAISLRRGDDDGYTIQIKERDGSNMNLSDKTIWLTVKPNRGGLADDSDAIFKWFIVISGGVVSSSNGLELVSAVNGQIHLTIDREETKDKAIGASWVYDIQIKDGSSDKVYTWDEGTLTISSDITQREFTP